MRKCDSCGKMYQESKDLFCPHCGAIAVKKRDKNKDISYDELSSSRWIRNDVYGEQRASENLSRQSERDIEVDDGEARFSERADDFERSLSNRNGSYTGHTSPYKDDANTYTNQAPASTTAKKASYPFGKTPKVVAIIISVVVAVNILAGVVLQFEEDGFLNDFSYDYSADKADYDFGGFKYDAAIGDISLSSEFTKEDEQNGTVTIVGEIADLHTENGSFDEEFKSAIKSGEVTAVLEYGAIPFDDNYDGGVFGDDIYAKDIESTLTSEACSAFFDGKFKVTLPYNDGSYYFPKTLKIAYNNNLKTLRFPFQCFEVVGDSVDCYTLSIYKDDDYSLDAECWYYYDNDGNYTDYYEF